MTSLAEDRPATFQWILGSLSNVGVVGSEGEHSFATHDLSAIEASLRDAGYTGGPPTIGVPARPRDGVNLLLFDGDRFHGVDEAEQAWTADYLRRWRRRVETEVDDWLARLTGLRSQIQQWLIETPAFASICVVDEAPAAMNEHLMKRFGVKPARMPVFELRTESQRVMRFQPKGLWVIGANGRVDLVTRSATPILIDNSKPLSELRDWRLYYTKNARPVPFDKINFDSIVSSGLR